MNYDRIYSNLVNSAEHPSKPRQTKAGYELHHIIPRSMGGSDDLDNLVFLTYKAHYTAHHLLAKIYGGKMYDAYWIMSNSKHRKVTSSQYAYAKAKKFENQRGAKRSDKTKKLMSIARSKVTLPDDFGKRISDGLTGRTLSTNHKEHIKNSSRKRFNTKTVIGYSPDGNTIELTGATEIRNAGFFHSAVYKCCKGIQSIHKGYTWKYKDEL